MFNPPKWGELDILQARNLSNWYLTKRIKEVYLGWVRVVNCYWHITICRHVMWDICEVSLGGKLDPNYIWLHLRHMTFTSKPDFRKAHFRGEDDPIHHWFGWPFPTTKVAWPFPFRAPSAGLFLSLASFLKDSAGRKQTIKDALENLHSVLNQHKMGQIPTNQRYTANISRHYKCIKTVGNVYLVYHLEHNDA